MSFFDLSLCLVILCSLLIYIWNDTSLISDILNAVTLNKFKIFTKWKVDLFSNFPRTIEAEHPCFFTKLLACPFCLSFWMTAGLFCLFGLLHVFPGLIFYPLYWYGIYFTYILIKKLEI